MEDKLAIISSKNFIGNNIFINTLNTLSSENRNIFIDKVLHLISIIEINEQDYDAKRSISYLLNHLDSYIIVSIIIDDLESFKKSAKFDNNYDILEYFLNSVLCTSKIIFQYLYENYPHCKKHPYLISYVICSRDIEWILNLINELSIDISEPKYCFWIYAHRMKLTQDLEKMLIKK